MTIRQPWIPAAEATALLGVTRATLYAYVSRGFVRSQSVAGSARARAYSRDDVERLRRKSEGRRDPDNAAAHALHWGVPVLQSAITLIDGNRFYYRGHDAVALARTRSVREIASLIWTGRFDAALDRGGIASGAGPRRHGGAPFSARAHAALARAAAGDPGAFDTRPEHVPRCGWRILHLLAGVAAGRAVSGGAVDETLAAAWHAGPHSADVLRTALVLCADHELNVSSFTARCVASAGSGPYAVVTGGLAALEGPRHGGAGVRVEAMLASLRGARNLRSEIGARLRRGESVEGFGHPLYPDGDPRAAAMIELLRARYPRSGELAFALAVVKAATAEGREKPNVDFALATVARVLRLPAGAPFVIFAVGRAIGWIGHAIEQYATGQLIRPRANYVGPPPQVS